MRRSYVCAAHNADEGPEGNVKKLIAAVTAACAVAAGVIILAPSAGAAPQGASLINWGQCQDEDLQKAGAECAMLPVPLDYADPAGEKIEIALSRVKHKVSQDRYLGPILVNPGGP